MESCHWIHSIFVIHITEDFQKMRGVVRSAILATAGAVFQADSELRVCFGLERKWGSVALELVPSPCVVGTGDNQKLILPEGRWSHCLLTLESRPSLPGARESWISR